MTSHHFVVALSAALRPAPAEGKYGAGSRVGAVFAAAPRA